MKRAKQLILMFSICLAMAFAISPIRSEAASLSRKAATIGAGQKVTLKVKGTSKKAKWSSSKKSVATVSSKGVVTGKKHGTATISAKVSGKTYKCKITVKAVLNKTKITVDAGKTYTLVMKGKTKTVKWSSSNKKIATVSSKGVVTGKAEGTATITAKMGTHKKTCKVTVKPTLNATKKSLYVGNTYQLRVVGKSGTATWKTSNSKVATVTNGQVKAVAPGTATIAATIGKVKMTCKVTVKSGFELLEESLNIEYMGYMDISYYVPAKVSIEVENSEIADIEYISEEPYDEYWGGGYIDFNVYGYETGTTNIIITNDYNNEVIKIPVKVTRPAEPTRYQQLIDYIIKNGTIDENGTKGLRTSSQDGDNKITLDITYDSDADMIIIMKTALNEADLSIFAAGVGVADKSGQKTEAAVVEMEGWNMGIGYAEIDVATYKGDDIQFIDGIEENTASAQNQTKYNQAMREVFAEGGELLATHGFSWADLGFAAMETTP